MNAPIGLFNSLAWRDQLVPEQNTSTNAQTIISLVQSKIGYKYDPIEAVYYYIFRQQMVLLQVSKVKLSNFYIQ